jgi:hypothetical protein
MPKKTKRNSSNPRNTRKNKELDKKLVTSGESGAGESQEPQESTEMEELDNNLTESPPDQAEQEKKKEEEAKIFEQALKADEDQKKAEKDESDSMYESATRMALASKLLQQAKSARERYDRDWLSRDLFRRGYQFASQQGTSVILANSSQARIPVNLLWAFIRSIRNQVTSFNPKWEVMPEFKGKESEENARLTGKLLDYLFVKMNLVKKIKDAVTQGLMFSIGGPFEVVWNPNYDNGPHQPKGEVEIILHDPFDVYFDPNATDMDSCEYIIKAVKTSVSEIRNNESYGDIRLMLETGSSKQAESEYKQFLIQTIQSGKISTPEEETVILYELQKKERKSDGNIGIRYYTWVDQLPIPLRDELIDQEEFDMEIFQADSNPLEMYGESWSKHVIALNKIVNALESSIFEYNYRCAKGRFVIDKNSGIKAITNEHGSIIEKNRGAEIKSLPLQSLPPSVENQIIRIKSMLEDISGVHDVSLGRTPVGIKAGIALAELKQSDTSNQDDLVQNLELCLMRLGKKVLKKVAKYYTTPRIVKVVGTGRMVEHFAVVGENYIPENKNTWKIKAEKYPLDRISSNNELQVQIGSWLSYSKEAQQKTILELAKDGLISQEDVLKYLEFPNVQEIIDKTRSERIIEMKRKENQIMPSGISQEELALSENEMLLEGNPMPVDPEQDDHVLHISIHSANPGSKDSPQMRDHIAEHVRAQKGGGIPLSQQGIPNELNQMQPGAEATQGTQGQPQQIPEQIPAQVPMPGQMPMEAQAQPTSVPMPA